MTLLVDIQGKFLKMITTGSDDFSKLVKPSSIPIEERLKVYQGTIFNTLTNALFLIFPLIWKLIGKECAEGVAHHFAKSHLPQTGTLDDWGADFPEFLRTFAPLKHLDYLEDVALFEWAKHRAYCAAEESPLDLEKMQKIVSQHASEFIFQCHPSMQFVSSSYPLDKIVELVENPEAPPLNLKSGKAFGLIVRPFDIIHVHWMTEEMFAFFSTLQEGISLGGAHLRAQQIAPLDAQEALLFAFRNTLFVDINCEI